MAAVSGERRFLAARIAWSEGTARGVPTPAGNGSRWAHSRSARGGGAGKRFEL